MELVTKIEKPARFRIDGRVNPRSRAFVDLADEAVIYIAAVLIF